ncbi:hypothetical protein [Metasolibacillus sp.]|uniref:hypothetical protein n=1 Tax=Metasolibacillus sp. TaxID=2703680 RepID=UPI0025E96F0F|nr:hypothetical protein [Metasolibacillus sp.]MCT6924831.1 hypothetical protein [Metasolibacillus sp.]MCT6941099.1 hypothetical protein [Metasolibacillus sp.]
MMEVIVYGNEDEEANIIDEKLLRNIVGFRNTAVHDVQAIELTISQLICKEF